MTMSGNRRIIQSESYPSHSPVYLDDRKGLGYGQTSQTGFSSLRGEQETYPYLEPDLHVDDLDDILDDDDLDVFVKKVNGNMYPTDSMAGNRVDRASFVGGSTRGLTGVMESQMAIAKNSISAQPGLANRSSGTSGGVNMSVAFNPGPALRTGTKRGISHAPPPLQGLPEEEIAAFTIQDILSDDEKILAKADMIRDRIGKLNKKGDYV